MRLLTGTYFHSIDSKGRLTLPGKLRQLMPEGGTVAEGVEHCLYLFPIDAWREQAEKLVGLDDLAPDARDAKRRMFALAEECMFDKQGRIMIPAHLRQQAGIDKEVAVVGVGNLVEIWDSEEWRRKKQSIDDNAPEIFLRARGRSINST